MKHDLRHSEESALNQRALVKAAGVGGLVVMIAWLGSMMFPPALLTTFLWIVGGTLLAAVVSAFLAGHLCGLRRRDDGVAHGILSWSVVMLFTALMMLPSVNAIDLGALQSSLLDRVKVLAVEKPAPTITLRQIERSLRARCGASESRQTPRLWQRSHSMPPTEIP